LRISWAVVIGKVLLQLMDARTFVRNHDGIKTGYTEYVRGARRGCDAFATAERSDALLASQAFEHDPDLLFGGELSAGLAADVADGLLGRVFLGHGSYPLSESRTLSVLPSIWSKLS